MKTIHRSYYAFILSAALCCSAVIPESASVSSSNAVYDGNALILTGQVLLDHGLGKMHAQRASLEKQENGKDFPFSLVALSQDVLLQLEGKAELSCEQASFDFIALEGTLLGDERQKVVYTDIPKRKKGKEAPLSLTSPRLELSLSKQEQEGKKTAYAIETILAKEGVTIQYAKNFVLQADHALFRKQDNNASNKEFQGLITAYPKDSESHCRLTHERDIIDAESVDLDLAQNKLSLNRPKGSLASSFIPHLQDEALQFTANYLSWDQDAMTLSLDGNVHAEERAFGELTSEHLELVQAIGKKGRFLKILRAKGTTVLHYPDAAKQMTHTLTSHGTLTIDRQTLSATVESPMAQGRVLDNKQICYQTQQATIFGDKASVEYSLIENKLQPVSLSLKGHLRLISQAEGTHKRCALAERMTYSPTTHTLILAADPGKKVLFWDEEQKLRMSAPEIHITRDPVTHKDVIKGIGSVQFTLSDDEQNRLKHFFPFFQ